jgi:hypothetical protein
MLSVTLAQPTRIDALDIAAGVWKSEKLFARNNLPTRLEVSGMPTFPDQPVTHKNAKGMRRDCLAYRKQEVPMRANPCPTGNDEPVAVSGGGGGVDVHLHSMCGYTVAPVCSLVWRAGAWKLSQIRVESLP